MGAKALFFMQKGKTMSKKFYPEVSAKPDFPKLEKDILAYWETNNTFRKTLEKNREKDEFVMYDGPAFANGMPHYGHILTAYAKDLIPRYHTMRGKFVPRNIGWDCHGLPAEADAEKYLNISGRNEIIDFGIGKFNAVCKERVTMWENAWEGIYARMGRWIELDRSWRTMDITYMESVIWAFKQMFDKGLVYEGKYAIWYSYAAESTVSNSETKQDDCYREREDTAVTVMFELDDMIDGKPSYVLAWTTTPWTLTSNFALCAGPDIEYAVMEEGGKHYIIGDATREKYKKQLENATLVKIIKGTELVGKTYKPLFDFFAHNTTGAFKIVGADFVTTNDGTGVVHLAPFGEDDLIIMQAEGIGWHAPVDGQGKFTKQVGAYAGMLVFDAVPVIVDDLKKSGKLVKREQFRHNYPHCWRTRVPLISMPLNSWYVDVPKFRDRSAELNKTISWLPENIRDGQMGKWLEGARPWAISRSRFFGVPLPIWKSDNPDFPRIDVYGSIAEMERDFGQKIESLHRPYIDDVTRPNPDDPSGQSMMRRIPDVFDCWFESGAAPFASLHYPFNNKEWFETNFPSDFVVEYISQTRGWFYTLMNLATPLFDKVPFKTAICHGVVLDETGKKLSKSLRNYVDPTDVMEDLGADALRWFLMGSPVLTGGNLVIDTECKEISKSMRQVIMPLWSAYYFFTLYANAESINAFEIKGSNNLMDKYILSKMRTMVVNVTQLLDESRINECAPLFTEFMEILNNWYIRRSRERFWDGTDQDAFNTLYTVLITLCKTLAPFMPMTTEYIYRALTGAESVHMCDWPDVSEIVYDPRLENDIDKVQKIIATGKALREDNKLRTRLPLANMTIAMTNISSLDNAMKEIIADEMNVKQVIILDEVSNFADSFVFPITPKIAARLGGQSLKDILPAIKSGNYEIKDGELYVAGGLTPPLQGDEFEIRLTIKPGITGAALPDNTAVVVLDTQLTPELVAEGLARDALRFIQDSRKDAGLDVSDRIVLEYYADDELQRALKTHEAMIKDNALITELRITDTNHQHDFTTTIENHKFGIKIIKQ